jgi:hypothetical protein
MIEKFCGVKIAFFHWMSFALPLLRAGVFFDVLGGLAIWAGLCLLLPMAGWA